MKISLNWLKEFVEIDVPTERLAELLITAGLEVEGVARLGEGLGNVVVARILSMRPHPNADRLTLCSVTTGDREHAIVCGAKNMKEGDHVALALPGAHLPNGVKIAKSKIRGEASEGMLCSEVELGLAKEASGIMILPAGLTLGEPVAKALMLEDTVLEISLTPNRPDCLSVIGIAREVSALTGKALKTTVGRIGGGAFDVDPGVPVDIIDLEGCIRYTGRVVKGVKVGPSPLWMKRRLEAAGMRSINNLVDITNYVMLETGQPLHAFDLNLLAGGRIVVRRAAGVEKIVTLDGVERALDSEVLVIADDKRPVAIAGVMGGIGSEVSESTADILLESACFKPSVVRRSAKRFGIHTESSHRFERGCDPNGVLDASDRAIDLILKLAGGRASREIDVYPAKINPVEIEMRIGKAEEVLGTKLNQDILIDCFKRLQFGVVRVDDYRIRVTPPSFRVDLTREIDLIEEAARMIGYDNIPVTNPKVEAVAGEKDRKGKLETATRSLLTGVGFHEAVTYSFVSPKALAPFVPAGSEPIRLMNPISEDQSVMRITIIPSLLEVAARNISRQNEDLMFFEIGRVFPLRGEETGERAMVAGIMIGSRYGKRWNMPVAEVDFFDLKGVVENLMESLGVQATYLPERVQYLHPGKTALICVDGIDAGIMGEIHPDITAAFDIKGRAFVFEMELGKIGESVKPVSFSHIPKYPAVYRDVAVLLDEDVRAEMVYKAIKSADPLVAEVSLFDLYQGKNIPDGKKSMAYSIRYQAGDRTLKEEEVNTLHEKVLAAIKNDVGGELRVS